MENPTPTTNFVEQNVAALKSEVTELKEILKNLQEQKLAQELQLPIELIQNSEEVKSVKRTKRGLGAIPLLESEIREAQDKTQTAADAARYLRVNYYTYRKYAKLYGVWKTNVHYKKEGIILDPEKGKYPLSKLISGEFPEYPIYQRKRTYNSQG
jgi:hypothetical protein